MKLVIPISINHHNIVIFLIAKIIKNDAESVRRFWVFDFILNRPLFIND